MDFIADILLIAGALGAGAYCFILSRRLRRFNDLEKGVGGAVAVLSAQVDDLTRTLSAAQGAASTSTRSLDGLTERAEAVARRLELLVASMHDIPQAAEPEPRREPAHPVVRQAGRPEDHEAGPRAERPAKADNEPDTTPMADPPPPEPVFRRHAPVAAGSAP
ncbi:MAG: hypothetical protein M5U35_02230 [Roseovarius sp.]|nr:hypothetical protein [Roseovarius sp.]